MAENKITYEEFLAQALQGIPEDKQQQWLTENSVESAPFLPEGWVVMAKDKNLPNYRNLDDFQDYEHAREIE